MKIRNDFVTNSSSSSYIISIVVEVDGERKTIDTKMSLNGDDTELYCSSTIGNESYNSNIEKYFHIAANKIKKNNLDFLKIYFPNINENSNTIIQLIQNFNGCGEYPIYLSKSLVGYLDENKIINLSKKNIEDCIMRDFSSCSIVGDITTIEQFDNKGNEEVYSTTSCDIPNEEKRLISHLNSGLFSPYPVEEVNKNQNFLRGNKMIDKEVIDFIDYILVSDNIDEIINNKLIYNEYVLLTLFANKEINNFVDEELCKFSLILSRLNLSNVNLNCVENLLAKNPLYDATIWNFSNIYLYNNEFVSSNFDEIIMDFNEVKKIFVYQSIRDIYRIVKCFEELASFDFSSSENTLNISWYKNINIEVLNCDIEGNYKIIPSFYCINNDKSTNEKLYSTKKSDYTNTYLYIELKCIPCSINDKIDLDDLYKVYVMTYEDFMKKIRNSYNTNVYNDCIESGVVTNAFSSNNDYMDINYTKELRNVTQVKYRVHLPGRLFSGTHTYLNIDKNTKFQDIHDVNCSLTAKKWEIDGCVSPSKIDDSSLKLEKKHRKIEKLATVTIDNLIYMYERKEAFVIGVVEPVEFLNIPNTITISKKVCNVVAINSDCFMNSNVKKVNLGQIKSLNKNCFDGCSSLEEVIFSDNIIYIPAFCFNNCESLKEVNIPNVSWINESAFANCTNLLSVTFSNKLQYIDKNVFDNCVSLNNVIIPEGVLVLDQECFNNCKSLDNLVIKSAFSIKEFAFKDCPIKRIELPYNLNDISGSSFDIFKFNIEIIFNNDNFIIEDGIVYSSDKSTLLFCLREFNLNKFVLPSHVNLVGKFSFYKNPIIEEFDLNHEVELESKTFVLCDNLRKANIDVEIYLTSETFSLCCNLEEVNIKKLIFSKFIDPYYYSPSYSPIIRCPKLILNDKNSLIKHNFLQWDDKLVLYMGNGSEFHYDKDINNVLNYAFSCTNSLKTCYFEEGVLSSNKAVFSHCTSLETVHLPSSFDKIDKFMFFGCSNLKTIIFPNCSDTKLNPIYRESNIKSIREYALSECTSLEKLVLSNSIITLSKGCFEGCSNFLEIFIPNSVKTIRADVFKGCENLKIYVERTKKLTDWDDNWNCGCEVIWGAPSIGELPVVKTRVVKETKKPKEVNQDDVNNVNPSCTKNIETFSPLNDFSNEECDITNIDNISESDVQDDLTIDKNNLPFDIKIADSNFSDKVKLILEDKGVIYISEIINYMYNDYKKFDDLSTLELIDFVREIVTFKSSILNIKEVLIVDELILSSMAFIFLLRKDLIVCSQLLSFTRFEMSSLKAIGPISYDKIEKYILKNNPEIEFDNSIEQYYDDVIYYGDPAMDVGPVFEEGPVFDNEFVCIDSNSEYNYISTEDEFSDFDNNIPHFTYNGTKYKDKDVDSFDLSVRLINCLRDSGYTKISQLVELDDTSFLKIRNLGEKSHKEIKCFILEYLVYEENFFKVVSNQKINADLICKKLFNEFNPIIEKYNVFRDEFFIYFENYIKTIADNSIIHEEYNNFILNYDVKGFITYYITNTLDYRNFIYSKLNESHGGFTFNEVRNFTVYLIENELIVDILSSMCDENKIKFIKDKYSIIYPKCDLFLKQILNEREYMVINERFNNITLNSIGASIGVTSERIRQIEISAIKKIKTSNFICYEDKFKYLYEKYNIHINDYKLVDSIYNFNYLSARFSNKTIEKKPLEYAIYDENLDCNVREMIKKTLI